MAEEYRNSMLRLIDAYRNIMQAHIDFYKDYCNAMLNTWTKEGMETMAKQFNNMQSPFYK